MRNLHLHLIANSLRNMGFGIKIDSDSVFVYLTARKVGMMEVERALDDLGDLVTMSAATRQNRIGVAVRI